MQNRLLPAVTASLALLTCAASLHGQGFVDELLEISTEPPIDRARATTLADEADLPWRNVAELRLSAPADVSFGVLSSFQDEEAAAPVASPASGAGDLAAAAQNPIASTISVPFENTLRFHSGLDDETSYVLNFQPVIPVKLTDEWNLINRPIIPIMYVPGFVDGIPGIGGQQDSFDDAFGLGDINYTAFFSPSNSDGLIWGFGPSLTLPTATDDALGSGKWSLGPSFVGLTIKKPILAGVLVRHIWSFAGDSDRRSVNQSMLQPFLNYNLEGGWYLMTAPVITYDWAADSGNWSVPLGGGVGKLMKLGDQPINMNLQLYYDIQHTDTSSDFQLKFVFQLLFPK